MMPRSPLGSASTGASSPSATSWSMHTLRSTTSLSGRRSRRTCRFSAVRWTSFWPSP